MDNKIVHLKLHTEYSLLDGVGKIDEYIKKSKELGLETLAITDTSMFGTIEFYKKCKKLNIKPIIGLEVYLDGIVSEGEYSLTLIAKNNEGYRNLSKLSSLSYSRYNRQRNKIKYEELMQYSSNLYVFSGGINSEVVKGLLDYKYPEVKRLIKKLYSDFGQNFYIEVPAIKKIRTILSSLNEIIIDTEINYIVTDEIYYPNKGEAILQKIMHSIKEGNRIENIENDIIYDDLYMKKYDEVKNIFSEFEENFLEKGIENTEEIVSNCNVSFDFNTFKFPKYNLPTGITEEYYLRKLVYEGISKKYLNKKIKIEEIEDTKQIIEELNTKNLNKITERIEYELEIINKMGYSGYFIIVWDFIKFAKENGIYVGPGRGSAAGSIVSYALNITEIDPIKYNLIFERFLNPERISMPDIDIDFDQEQREIVIDYVIKKYGKEYVAHIITFGTLKARAAIRDVGRVLNIDLRKVDRIAKLIPFMVDLEDALKTINDLKILYNSDREIKMLIDYSLKIEGRARHTSVHAAGIVISKGKLDEEIPTYSDGKALSTQYQMKELEDLGILKMDFLGLKNLTILRKTIENIYNSKKEIITLESINLEQNDENKEKVKKTYDLMTKADTLGIFQCESLGIRNLMKKVKIEKFEDIIALLALYRPGPLRSGMVDDFIESKNNKKEIKYPDDSLKEILKETYGVILYQEQVMKIASKMANYSLGEADVLRRAIGKKIPQIIEENREKFVRESIENGINKEKANEIYNLIDKFGGYGFNKSHSAAYALIVYWTAYFKINYPVEFFAAVMSTEMYNVDRLSLFITEAREKNIEILVPDINFSSYEFKEENNCIRFGLVAIKGIGDVLVKEIIEERKKKLFDSYEDFVYRMKQKGLNKKQLEALILSGSLDCFKGNRKEKVLSIDKIMEWSQKKYDSEEDVQMILFSGKSYKIEEFIMNKVEEYPQKILLKYEKEYLGVYISSNPLNSKKNFLEIIEHTKIKEIESNKINLNQNNKVKIIGIIKNISKIVTRKSREPMAKFIIEDRDRMIDAICFPRDFINLSYKIIEDSIILAEGNLLKENEKYSIVVNRIDDLNDLNENENLKLYILIDEESKTKKENLRKLILKNKGTTKIIFAVNSNGKKEIQELDNKYNVNLSEKFIGDLVNIIGVKKIKIR